MSKAYAFLAEGFETVEALAVVDILRRAGVEVNTVSITESSYVVSAHKIMIKTDKVIDEIDGKDADLIFLPGGMPGTLNLDANKKVINIVRKQYDAGKLVAAICAAPSIFGRMGILRGKKATCYPGFESDLLGADYYEDRVVVDGNVVTSKGMGTSIDLGIKLIELLEGEDSAEKIARSIQYI